MQDIVWLAYISLWVTAARYAARIPSLVPRVINAGNFAYIPDQRAMGCMMTLFIVLGGMIGGFEPVAIYDFFFKDVKIGFWPPDTLDGLGRVAQVVGLVCGVYVGARAVRIWIILFLCWCALIALDYLFRFVFHTS